MRRSALLLLLLAASSPRAAETKFQEVTVRPGDTLWGIARAYLKDPRRWGEILRHNSLPASDPTAALPGMVLKVPVELIREELRAAQLVFMARKVLFRKKETAAWDDAKPRMTLYRGDGLRTLEESRARVQFVEGAVLSLEPNSMAILKPPKESEDLRLMRGMVHTTVARVATPSARIVPKGKDVSYSAKVLEDLSTQVQVHRGAADVEGGGRHVEVQAGYFTQVALDKSPAEPIRMSNIEKIRSEILDIGISNARFSEEKAGAPSPEVEGGFVPTVKAVVRMREIPVGVPIAAYRVQVSRERDFASRDFDKVYESDEPIDLGKSALPPGRYWVRVAPIDLLGIEERFSEPKSYSVGSLEEAGDRIVGNFEILYPSQERVLSRHPTFHLVGRADAGLDVRVMGQSVARGEDGVFRVDVKLLRGVNRVVAEALDLRGNSRKIWREITFEP